MFFVFPHSSDDAVGEVAFVASAGFSFGFSFAGFALEVCNGLWLVPGLGDRSDVENAVDFPVASKIKSVSDGLGGSFALR